MQTFLYGLMICFSLIMAIGAQNIFVLKQGLLKQHIGATVLICWLCDIVLMGAGVFGIGLLLAQNQVASGALALAGGIFLLVYGLRCAISAYKGGMSLSVQTSSSQTVPMWKTLTSLLAITLLNPHVYIDTVVLIGGAAAHYPLAQKWWFFAGVITASAIWFCALGFGARLLRPFFARERTWRILDSLVALMMWYLALGLLQQAITALRNT